MALRTYGLYIINLLLISLIAFPAIAQNGKKPATPEEPKIPFYNGLTASVDVFGLGSKLFGSDFLSVEAAIEANLKNRYMPVFEFGYGTTDEWNEIGTKVKTAAPYFRIGMNYNTMAKKGVDNFLYVGLRYGFTSFNYDIQVAAANDEVWAPGAPPVANDDIWGVPIHYPDQIGLKGSMHWAEFIVGVNVKIIKNFHMGWGLRIKSRLSYSASEYGDPYYVPGFGEFGSSSVGVTYSLIYKLPF